MGALRTQISWLARGGAHTRAALDEHAAAIRQLQGQVASLAETVSRLDETIGRFDAVAGHLPDATRAAVDDLGRRIGTLCDRVEALES